MSTGDLSTLLVWAAATALTIALAAAAVDLARLAERAQRRREPAVAARAAVPAGAGLGGGSGLVVDAGAPASVPDGTGSRRSQGIARSTTLLGGLLLLAAVVLRGVAAGRWPTANMYEFTLVGVLVAVGVLVVVQRRRFLAFVSVLVLGVAVLALVLALNTLFVQADAVQPALQSYWLVIHVGVAISATGIFTVGAAAAVLQLMRQAREEGLARAADPSGSPREASELASSGTSVEASVSASSGAAKGSQAKVPERRPAAWGVTGSRFAWLRQVPPARELEALSFRLNAFGFVLWTFTLIGGAIWAEHAWGRYWGWDPKEVGSFVAWVVYAAYLHARTTRGWSGGRAAWFALAGYACVLANFTLVNLFVSGLHSYSGL